MKLKDRTVILTGASRGFGCFLAKALHKEGASLVLVARDVAKLAALADQLRFSGNGGVQVVEADLRYPLAASARIMELSARFGDIHGLINNAAIQGPNCPALDTPWADYELTMTVNLFAPITLCKAFVPLMPGGGKIVNLSGGGATGPRPNFSAYATSKAALVRFSECLAEEVRERHIDVNSVAPGLMLTDMTKGQTDTTPEQTVVTMAKAAALIVCLLSKDSDGITGRLISAPWDDWQIGDFKERVLANPNWLTLRRVSE